MTLAMKPTTCAKGKAAVRIVKSYVRYSTGSRMPSCTACTGAHPIDEIRDGLCVLAGMTTAIRRSRQLDVWKDSLRFILL